MIKDLLKKIKSVVNEYTTINCKFTMESKKEEPDVQWVLYINNVTNLTGDAFPTFNSFEQLKSFADILCLELKRVNQDAVKNAVEIAQELVLKQKG